MAHSETFGPHVNDLFERIQHKTNVRVAIIKALNSDDESKLFFSILGRPARKMKVKKIKFLAHERTN